MSMQIKIILAILFLPFFYNESFSQVQITDIDQFIRSSCIEDDSLSIELKFTPLIRLKQQEKEQRPGNFSYDFDPQILSNTNNKFSLNGATKDSLDLFVRVNRSNYDTGENYLWILLFTPLVNGQFYGGEVISIEEYRNRLFAIKKYDANDREDYNFLTRFSRSNNNTLIYKKEDIDDKLSWGQISKLEDKWRELVGSKIYAEIYRSFSALSDGGFSYTVSLYFIPTPSLHYIDQDTGYRWAINKVIDHKGEAFAMALTNDHKCVKHTSIQIVE